MREIEFNEGEFLNTEQLVQALFADENDPRSNNYKRVLQRPKINWFLVVLAVLSPFVVGGCSYAALSYGVCVATKYAVIISIFITVVYLVLILKHLLIGAVKIYQRFAPESLRNKCRFEPSCSEYMILSLKKYGLFKGLKKGINRLKRCNIHDGGYDMP